MKKLLILLMTVLLIMPFSMQNVKAQEDTEDESFTVEVLFDINTTNTLGKWIFDYSDSWFKQPAYQYNHKLARLSLGMAVSAFRPNLDPNGKENPALHLQAFLTDCHFSDLRTDDYDKNPSLFTVSTVMAHKELHDEHGEFELIAVGVCGGGYKNEWMSNFSCGDEEIHVGFLSAAIEVYDRLFGYIAMNCLSGKRCKVWVSGFSRAAAISNIFSKLLVDSDVFDTETVYAYTYATPRTTKNPEEGQYPNIFNICGKMDPVPQIAFADWGYDRYGTTLYTPSQQTDSDYNIRSAKASIIHKKYFGLEFFNNVEWDTKLRVVLNYLLKICPTSKIYKERLQDIVVRMWENKSISNIMTCLMEIASDEVLINDSNRTEANSMLTYLSYTIYGYLTRSDVDAKYRSEESTAKGNLAREHTPEVYLAWMFSTDDPDQLFSDRMNYLRVVISGDVDVAIFQNEPEYGLIKCVRSDGSLSGTFECGETYNLISGPDIFMERTHGEHIILLPKDRDYTIYVKSNISQKVEMHAIPLRVGYTNDDFSKLHYAQLEAGETDVLFSKANEDISADTEFDIEAGDTFDIVNISRNTSSELAISLERANILNLSWQQIVILVYTVPIVLLCLLVFVVSWAIGAHKVRVKKNLGILDSNARYDRKPAAAICTAIGLFLIQELLYWLMPQYLIQRAILKFLIGLFLVYLCYAGYRKQKTELSRYLLIALILCMIGDITINFNFTFGMAMFVVAEGLLAYEFVRFEHTDKWQWSLWALLVVISTAIIWFSSALNLQMKVAMSVYAVVLMVLVVSSLIMPRKMRYGSIAMAISNILLFVDEVSTRTLAVHVLSLGIYYLAIGLFAFATRFKEYVIPARRNEEIKNEENENGKH